jgi:hypothetical protein
MKANHSEIDEIKKLIEKFIKESEEKTNAKEFNQFRVTT